MNKDQIDGRVKEVTGKAQEVAGRVTGNAATEAKGTLKKNLGTAQAKAGDFVEDVKDAQKDAAKDAQREQRR